MVRQIIHDTPMDQIGLLNRITGFRLLPIKSILAVRDARLLVQSHAKEQYGGTPGGSLLKQLCSMM